MFKGYEPLLYGLAVMAAVISAATLLLRALGLGKGEAFYLACLGFGLLAYLVSRRALRRSRER